MGVGLSSWACILSSDSFHHGSRPLSCSSYARRVVDAGRGRWREAERPKREGDYGRGSRNGVKMQGQGKSGLAGSLE